MIVQAEEKYLEETFGEEFKAYKTNVPRFIPRLQNIKQAKWNSRRTI